LEPHEFELAAHLVGNVVEVLAITRREHHALEAGARGGDHLLLDAADGEHQAAQADLAGHGGVVWEGAGGPSRTPGPAHPDARARNAGGRGVGPSSGPAPAGTWTCTSVFSKLAGSTPNETARFLTRLSAACALSFITSPSWPVRMSRPPPGPRVASMNRMSPP